MSNLYEICIMKAYSRMEKTKRENMKERRRNWKTENEMIQETGRNKQKRKKEKRRKLVIMK